LTARRRIAYGIADDCAAQSAQSGADQSTLALMARLVTNYRAETRSECPAKHGALAGGCGVASCRKRQDKQRQQHRCVSFHWVYSRRPSPELFSQRTSALDLELTGAIKAALAT
jgi:hypothetical protein